MNLKNYFLSRLPMPGKVKVATLYSFSVKLFVCLVTEYLEFAAIRTQSIAVKVIVPENDRPRLFVALSN